MEKFEIVKYYEQFTERLNDITKVIQPEKIKAEMATLAEKMTQSDFWLDSSSANQVISNSNDLKDKISEYETLVYYHEELQTMIDFDDEAFFLEAEKLIPVIDSRLNDYEIKLLLSEQYDSLNAIVELHPGAGGTESQDWALMLYRMYKQFSEKKKFTFELIDYQEASDAGLKSVTFLVKGKNAYGIFKGEKGVHRLVRISPFDSNARRHTSFSACNVTPEIDDKIEVDINPNDLRIDTYRSSGAGGQYVNTTDSAIRITHLPTGIVASCQNERSQIQNREKAMSILKSRIYAKRLEEQEKMVKKIGGTLEDNAFGSQIRSYVLHPYAMVKDHRTNYESSNPKAVLDGDLDGFINAYLHYNAQNK